MECIGFERVRYSGLKADILKKTMYFTASKKSVTVLYFAKIQASCVKYDQRHRSVEQDRRMKLYKQYVN